MGCRRFLTATAGLLLLAAVGCSKTSDKPAETKIFGDPPAINSASLDVTQNHVLCDYTKAFDAYFLSNDGLQVSPGPLMIGGTYTQFVFHANVSDPQGRSDIILVTASFTFGGGTGPNSLPQEVSLVLFDDGSSPNISGNLVYQQSGSGQVPLQCSTDASQRTTCVTARNIPLTSNDPVAGDGNYTRGYAIPNFSTKNVNLGTPYAQDCVAIQAKQFPDANGSYNKPGTTLTFRIDAVDKEGNLSTFHNRLSGTVGTSAFECSGDDCLCCFARCSTQGLQSPDPGCAPGDPSCCNCQGLPGMIGASVPAGLCKGFSS